MGDVNGRGGGFLWERVGAAALSIGEKSCTARGGGTAGVNAGGQDVGECVDFALGNRGAAV